MEKIYMEENQKQQQQQQQKQQKRLFNISIILSFAVAVFGIFSIASFGLAVYGGKNSGVSYAVPTGDSFTFYKGQVSGAPMLVLGQSEDGQKSFQVPLYFSDSTFQSPIYCVEKGATVNDTVTYNKSSVPIDDYGLLYILNNSNANGKNIVDGEEAVEAWATQVAIWLYLHETKSSDPLNVLTTAELEGIQNATKFTATGESPIIVSGVYTKIRALVDAAKAASNVKVLSVNIDGTDPASIAEDKSFYQSPMVTVAGDGLISYNVSVGGVEGAYLVDVETGNNLNATNIPATTKFYVRIPADKVGEEKVDVTVSVTGRFNTLTGSYYTAATGDLQKVVSVTGSTLDVSDGASFEIIPTPATGMNMAQTIYFIGLIVLLCGVGIVYANAKPIENKQ